jgi:Leucine-rich repeat (LRR) protein
MGAGISGEWTVRRRIWEQSLEQDPFLRVSISSMGLNRVPVISRFCPIVTDLDISNNMITALPEHLQRIQNLSKLDVSTNQLSTLPDFLGSFVSLTDLRASDNNISQLPESLVLPSLTSLSICRNYLDHGLPAALCQSLSSLKILRLSNNGLGPAAASSTVALLTALVELNISVNNLGSETLCVDPLSSTANLFCCRISVMLRIARACRAQQPDLPALITDALCQRMPLT